MAEAALPEGLVYRPEFLTEDEEHDLLAFVEGLHFEPVVMRGQVARRTVRHFGFDYDYERRGQLKKGERFPEPLVRLRDRVAELPPIEPDRLVQALVSRYPPGAGIGWHRDAPMFGSAIVGVSLGSPARFRLREENGEAPPAEIELAPRSAYVLSGPSRWAWQHSIPEAKSLRYSVTFRSLREPE